LIRKTIILTTTLWVINEIIQLFVLYNKESPLGFFVVHLSSFYGAIIFCFLINYLKFTKILMIVPLVIELSESWITCNCIDYWDLLFSLIGICIANLIIHFETRKKVTI
jgi:hypothetical protein